MAALPVNPKDTPLRGFLKQPARVTDEHGCNTYIFDEELFDAGKVAADSFAKGWYSWCADALVPRILHALELNSDRLLIASNTSEVTLTWGEWEEPMNTRKLYEVTITPNRKVGVTDVATMHVVAESAEQAKLIAVHVGSYDPLTCVFFVQQIGVMPDYDEDEE